MSIESLVFDSQIGQTKVHYMRAPDLGCPFCNRDSLESIIAEEQPIILLMNKYPVLKDTFQTVLIETDDCRAEFSAYSPDHLHKVVRFGVKHWLAMENSGEYKSVLFFKNHGPYSGGTVAHPHMQIVGLKNIDYRDYIQRQYFEGLLIDKKNSAEFNLSTSPRIGFFEFNVILPSLDNIDQMADYVQTATHYIINHFHKNCNSYNLFFYNYDNKVFAKIIPRFITSPLFIGYSISQVSDRVPTVVNNVRDLYFQNT